MRDSQQKTPKQNKNILYDSLIKKSIKEKKKKESYNNDTEKK
jgi:hypothetical protein